MNDPCYQIGTYFIDGHGDIRLVVGFDEDERGRTKIAHIPAPGPSSVTWDLADDMGELAEVEPPELGGGR